MELIVLGKLVCQRRTNAGAPSLQRCMRAEAKAYTVFTV